MPLELISSRLYEWGMMPCSDALATYASFSDGELFSCGGIRPFAKKSTVIMRALGSVSSVSWNNSVLGGCTRYSSLPILARYMMVILSLSFDTISCQKILRANHALTG